MFLKYPLPKLLFLPAGLRYTRYLAFVCQLTEADTTDAELPHIAMGTTANFAAVIGLHLKFRCPLLFNNQGCFGHDVPSLT